MAYPRKSEAPAGSVSPGELARQLASNTVKPVVALFGDEELLISKAEAAILKTLLGDRKNDFNYEVIYCEKGSGRQLAESASTPPFGGGIKLVVGRTAQEMKDENDYEALTAYIMRPFKNSVLLLIYSDGSSPWGAGKTSGARAEFRAALKKNGSPVYYGLLDRPGLAAQLRREAEYLGFKVADEAIALLIEETGDELAFLLGALEQAALFARGGIIKTEDMRSIIVKLRGFSVFELTAALGDRDLPAALGMVESLVRSPKEMPQAMSMIARHFRMLIKVRDMLSRKATASDLASELGVPERFIKSEYIPQARNFPVGKLASALQYISEVDLDIRTSRLDGRLAVERLFVRLCA
jgi:DNA polymerase-3 subunit delta